MCTIELITEEDHRDLPVIVAYCADCAWSGDWRQGGPDGTVAAQVDAAYHLHLVGA